MSEAPVCEIYERRSNHWLLRTAGKNGVKSRQTTWGMLEQPSSTWHFGRCEAPDHVSSLEPTLRSSDDDRRMAPMRSNGR